jgi:hypothetical protein
MVVAVSKEGEGGVILELYEWGQMKGRRANALEVHRHQLQTKG